MDTIQQKDVRKNTFFAIVAGCMRSISLLCAYGTLFQTFLISLGFSSSDIYINNTIMQSAMLIVTPLCSKWADKGNIIKRAALVQLPTAVLLLFYLPICINHDGSPGAFWYLTGCSFLQVVFISLYTVVEYKLPYFIYPVESYGTIMSISGVVSNLISLGSGMLLTAATAWLPFPTLMLIACIASSVLMVLSSVISLKLKPLIHAEQMDVSKIGVIKKKDSLLTLFKTPIFARLAPANFLRGVASGAMGVMAAIALDLGYDESVVTLLISVTSGVTLVTYAVFGVMTKRLNPRTIIALGVSSVLLLPLMLLRSGSVHFLILFAITLFGRTLVDVGIPYVLRMAVPVGISGPYNAWRMILHNAGTLLMCAVAAWIPVEALLLIGPAAQLFVGASYFFDKELRKSIQPGNIQQ